MNGTNIFVSPHLDDICYSAFTAIKNCSSLSRTVIVTIFSKSCWTFLTKPCHEEALQVTNIRQKEEKEFAANIGAELNLLNLNDSSLRYQKFGEEYKTKSHNDPIYRLALVKLTDTLRTYEPISRIYIPLGISQHVDHLIARDIVLESEEFRNFVCLYEDLPYVARYKDEAIYRFVTKVAKSAISELRLTSSPELKVNAMQLYKSQLEPDTIATVIGYGLKLGNQKKLVERYWQF